MDYISILIVISIGWFIVEFEPIHFFIDAIKEKLPRNKTLDYLLGSFDCWQCMTFWSAIIYTQDFFMACIASLLSLIIQTWMQRR